MLKFMDWITDRIAIGNYLDAQDRTLLQAEGVRAVLSLDGTLEANRTADLGVQEIACHRLEE